MTDGKKLWTAKELSEHLGCSVEHVYRMARKKEIPCVHIGSHLRFSQEQIRDWINGTAKDAKK